MPLDPVAKAFETMEGHWTVTQHMWGGPGEDSVGLPAADVRRRLLSDTTVQEDMEVGTDAGDAAFRRNSVLNFNPVTSRFEYFSIDSRAPQFMTSQSGVVNHLTFTSIELDGGQFKAPAWGKFKDTAFHYRVSLSGVGTLSQILRLFLRPLPGAREEFLAFEYMYQRVQDF